MSRSRTASLPSVPSMLCTKSRWTMALTSSLANTSPRERIKSLPRTLTLLRPSRAACAKLMNLIYLSRTSHLRFKSRKLSVCLRRLAPSSPSSSDRVSTSTPMPPTASTLSSTVTSSTQNAPSNASTSQHLSVPVPCPSNFGCQLKNCTKNAS